MPNPEREYCEVRVDHMVALLGGSSYVVQCDHKNYALVTTFFLEGCVYVTLTMDDQDVELRFDMRDGAVVLHQGPAGSAGTGKEWGSNNDE